MTIKEKKAVREKEKKLVHRKIANGKRSTYEVYMKDKDFIAMRKTFD
jgi:hypothetical protein